MDEQEHRPYSPKQSSVAKTFNLPIAGWSGQKSETVSQSINFLTPLSFFLNVRSIRQSS